MSPFAGGFVSCLPAVVLCFQEAEALALETVCLVVRHPQPMLTVSTEKISAETRSDLVSYAGCSNYAHLHKCR